MQAGSLKDVVNIIPPLCIGYLAAVFEENNFKVSIIVYALNIQIKISRG